MAMSEVPQSFGKKWYQHFAESMTVSSDYCLMIEDFKKSAHIKIYEAWLSLLWAQLVSKGRSNYYKNLEQNLAAVTQLDCKQTSHFLEIQCRATKLP